MLSAAAILGIASIAVSQAEDIVDTPVTISEVEEAQEVVEDAPEVLGDETQAAADTGEGDAVADAAAEETVQAAAPAVEEEPIPEDTPQVQKLIALYPNLIARIQPVGNICYEGETCNVTTRAASASADGGPRDGATVYNAVCQTCHAAGLLGSPILGDAGAWGPRIAKGEETLYTHAIQGFNAMPAKGGADIPDEEVQNAVDYMISEAS
ncbi:c-type cytochrome [Psychrobacter jeotgali]|uniref:c-type cytochrome n=1 Tax=Psychrobacter jeotgali TaxID=179010 RepID=UPI001D121C9B|nr:c-type cytochrome [Psychrobacter jeotgali]